MTFEQLLLAAVEQRLLRPLDVQFALMVAQNDPPAVKLAAALLSRDAAPAAQLLVQIRHHRDGVSQPRIRRRCPMAAAAG